MVVVVVVSVALLVLGVVPSVVAGPSPAGAAVEHGQGFAGVVDGYRSWFGSYRLGALGEVWCVDHGIGAPDEALAYEPTGLDDRAPETRRAIAWAVGNHGVGPDRVGAAALMLVLHDLMGARYPSGPLSVDALTPSALSGFEGREADVLERARAIKAEAVERAALVGPLALAVSASPSPAGVLLAQVIDANGVGVPGARIHPAVTGAELVGDVDRITGDDGAASWTFAAGAGRATFELTATVPGVELVALQPTRGAAQRVARPSSVSVSGAAAFDLRSLTIEKRGDADLPVAGARFSVSGVDGELVVGDDGRTAPVLVPPGTYTVTEVAPPPGYDVAGPWMVVIDDADVVLDVLDLATRGWLEVRKVDARTGASLDGATFEVTAERDGRVLDDWTGPLLPGRYRVREVEPPAHHQRATADVVAEVKAGERSVVQVPNVGLASVAFEKHPPLAGATFAVTAGVVEAGRCTTDVGGRCSLPDDALEAGTEVCWSEVEAPRGWAKADGGCVTLGSAGSVTTVVVEEVPLPVPPPSSPVAPPEPGLAPPPAPPVAPPEPEAPVPAEVLHAEPVTRAAPAPELPRTGPPDGTRRLAGLGLVLLGCGTGLLLATRRRAPNRFVSGIPPNSAGSR